MEETFGAFISRKRNEKQITLRGFAKLTDVSVAYMSNIENNLRPAPSLKKLNKFSYVLALNDKEREVMFDLAAKSKKQVTVPLDIAEYLSGNEAAHCALRIAKRCAASENDWEYFVAFLSDKYF